MDVSEAIRTKRATRDFADRPVAEEVVHRILNGGRRAQSSKNTQPWNFVVVREREALRRLSQCGRYAGHLAGAAFALALVSPDPATRWSIAFDLGQAAAYMQLAAWEIGIGSCIASIYEPAKARAVLGIPENMFFDVALSFGYPASGEPGLVRPKKGGRKVLDEIVHWDRW